MIKLENIRKNNNVIECDLIPENSNKSCLFSYDIVSGKVSCVLPVGYEYCSAHITMVTNWIKKNVSNLPSKKTIMWY